MNTESFKSWSDEWKAARSDVGNIDCVLQLWKKQPPGKWKRKGWTGQLGFRKNHRHNGEDRGEQKIERIFLGCGEPKQLSWYCDKTEDAVISLYHNLALTRIKHGQVVADAFAIVTVNRKVHPLLVEIKTRDKNCWFALVQNLQQVRLARACEESLRSRFESVVKVKFKGAWGMVLAPKSYFEKPGNRSALQKSKSLLDRLKNKEARVAFGFTDEIDDQKKIRILYSNWPI